MPKWIIIALIIIILYIAFQRTRKDTPIFYRKKMLGNYNARTIPPFGIYVLESQRNNSALLNHERIHWKQFKEKGLLGFYIDYANQLAKHGYDAMPMEIEARVNESDYCRENYTDCVRNGLSNTVYNPTFRN